MGIKDETPDDKVIFDSVDARMKYSKGIQKEVKTCENCYNDILVPIEHGDICIHFVDERKEI